MGRARPAQLSRMLCHMFSRILCGALIGGTFSLATPAIAQTPPPPASEQNALARTPADWLESMSDALQNISFRGRSIYLSGDQLTTVEILRGVVNGEAWERVVHLSGEPAEILRKGNRVACLHPDGVSELKDDTQRVPEIASAAITAAAGFPERWNTTQYRLHEGPDDRIAGRLAKRIDILPADRFRYGLHLWLDKDTSLLLKSVIVDQRGRALDMFEFVSIDVDVPLKAGDFEPANGLQWLAETAGQDAETKPNNDWQPGWLPAGFKVSSHVLRPASSAIFAQSFSDGIAAFTLFVEPIAENDEMEGSRQHGATVAVSYRAPQPNDQWRVTVVGEIPLETAMQVASYVQRKALRKPAAAQ